MSETQQFCTFMLDALYFGIEVLNVQEVIRYQEMTPVPLAPPVVSGLINLRGQIVTALDLRRRLNLRERGEEELPMNVIVRTDDGAVSLLVDEIDDVLEIAEDRFERPPETMSDATREMIRGVYKLPDRLLLVLDTEKAVNLGSVSRGSL